MIYWTIQTVPYRNHSTSCLIQLKQRKPRSQVLTNVVRMIVFWPLLLNLAVPARRTFLELSKCCIYKNEGQFVGLIVLGFGGVDLIVLQYKYLLLNDGPAGPRTRLPPIWKLSERRSVAGLCIFQTKTARPCHELAFHVRNVFVRKTPWMSCPKCFSTKPRAPRGTTTIHINI